MMGLFFSQDLNQNQLQRLLTTEDTEVDGGNLDLFENQDHEKNDGPIFHAGFRSIPKSKAIHHGGRGGGHKA